MKRSWVEVSLSRLRHNVAVVSRLACGRPIVAVVKANAYGHGLAGTVQALWSSGVRSFAVAELEEAGEVRQLLPEASILVLGGCDSGLEPDFRALGLTAALFQEQVPRGVPVEIELETGMGRLGLPEIRLSAMAETLGTQLRGIYSTLACSDQDRDFTSAQIGRFKAATARFPVRRHLANSAGLGFAEALLDAVRPGLALYGISAGDAASELQPALRWKARILAVNQLPVGATVGYGATWRASRPSRIAVIAAGYADGYSRRLSNSGMVLTAKGSASVVGRISMDLSAVDITDLPDVEVGSEVTLLEREHGSPISATALARQLGTIPYEVLTAIGPRVPRLFVE